MFLQDAHDPKIRVLLKFGWTTGHTRWLVTLMQRLKSNIVPDKFCNTITT